MTEILDLLLFPFKKNEFFEKYFSKKAINIKKQEDRYIFPFNWKKLNNIISCSIFEPGDVFLISDGFAENYPEGQPESYKIISSCMEGKSLHIENLHLYDKDIYDLLFRLCNETGVNNKISLDASHPNFNKNVPDKRNCDSFILQIEGSVSYQIFLPVIDNNSLPSDNYFECSLNKGDILYIPNGHWKLRKAESPSLNIEISTFWENGINYINLFNQISEFNLPLPITDKNNISYDEWTGYQNKIKNIFAEKFKDRSTDNLFINSSKDNLPEKMYFNFPCHYLERPIEEYSEKHFYKENNQKIEINEDGRVNFFNNEITFEKEIIPFLKFINEKENFSGNEIMNTFPDLFTERITDVLNLLIRHGILKF